MEIQITETTHNSKFFTYAAEAIDKKKIVDAYAWAEKKDDGWHLSDNPGSGTPFEINESTHEAKQIAYYQVQQRAKEFQNKHAPIKDLTKKLE